MLSLAKLNIILNSHTGRKKLILLMCLSLAVLCAVAGYIYLEKERHKFKVTFLNVGQGDASLIQFSNGEKMLVDCGPNRSILSALGRNMAFYDRNLEYVLITHPDLDHYGGCIDVLKNYNVKKIISNGKEKPFDPYWRELNKELNRSRAELGTIDKAKFWTIASDTLQFISPDPTIPLQVKEADSNNFSIVFRLTHGNQKFLFTGDMEEALEKLLIDKYCSSTSTCPLRSDVLKVGHHGSDGSSSELFLSFVKPSIAVISVGKNKYGHPTLRAVRHLERAETLIKRTDVIGDIVIKY